MKLNHLIIFYEKYFFYLKHKIIWENNGPSARSTTPKKLFLNHNNLTKVSVVYLSVTVYANEKHRFITK